MVVFHNDIINAIAQARNIRHLLASDILERWQQGEEATAEQTQSLIQLGDWIDFLTDAEQLVVEECIDNTDVWNIIQQISEQAIGLDCVGTNYNYNNPPPTPVPNAYNYVESVTGLNTNNLDPQNPVVRISVDGTTITGQGTPSSPLVASIPSTGVQTVTDDGNGVVSVDNTDAQNPIIQFNGVNVDGVTITGDGTSGNPLVAASAGGVTSVTATSPITSSGGATPDISTSMNTNKLIGRSTAGVGVMEEITIGSGLSLSAGTLTSTASGGGIPHTTASGTDTYTATVTGVTAYNDGDAYLVRFTNGNTTSCTLQINSITPAVPLYRNNDGALIGGDIWDGAEMLCIYNSTLSAFQCIGTSSNSLFAYVTNGEASTTITKGQAVYVSGGTGDRIKVQLANNSSDTTSAQTIGIVVTSSIAANQKGIVITQGQLDGLSLFPTSSGWADGDFVYLDSTSGAVTKTKPYAPYHLVYLGYVVKASNGAAGRMYVKVQNGYEMDELHNVSAQTPANGDILVYNTSTSLWETSFAKELELSLISSFRFLTGN